MTGMSRKHVEIHVKGIAVGMLAPADGPVHVLVVGEAPGPRGADKSGYPFFGDGAGLHLYTALERLGAMTLPPDVHTMPWSGALFAQADLRPKPQGVALTNAFDRCPSDDGVSFRAPTRAELRSEANFRRIHTEVSHLLDRGLRGIVTLGRVATSTIDEFMVLHPLFESRIARRALAHPSAQGLLSMAPHRGKGARITDLQKVWMEQCQAAIVEAGYAFARSEPRVRGRS